MGLRASRTAQGVTWLGLSLPLAAALECGAATAEMPLVLEEITVTAQKREQSAQEVPIAMSVLSGERMAVLGVNKTEDLASFVPNLAIRKTKGENMPTVTIRGVGLATGDTNYATSTSSTAVHVDEVYFGSPSVLGFQLFDIERVEVLKGPQGTLYGRNSTAGSINYVTSRPSHDFAGRFSAGYDNFSVLSSEGFVNGALSDSTAARVAWRYENGDSYQEDLQGDRWEGPDRLAGRASLLFEPTPDFDALVRVYAGRDRSGIGRNHVRGMHEDVWVADGNIPGRYDIDAHGLTATANWRLNNGSRLSAVANYNRLQALLPDEADGEAIRLQEGFVEDELEQYSQELRWAGGGERVEWVAGLYHFSEQIDQHREFDFFAWLYPPGDFEPGIKYWSSQETSANAVFGQLEYAPIEKLNVAVGVRWSEERKRFEVTNLFNNFIGGVLGVTQLDPASGMLARNLDTRHSKRWSDVSGRLSVNYFVSDGAMLYASVSNGFKSGGYLGAVTILPEAVRTPADPEDLTAYEIGVKSTLADGRLRLNASGFVYDYKDMQAESIIFEGMVPFQTLVNIQKVDIQGFDLELGFAPGRAFEASLAVGYTDGEHAKFVTGDGDFSGSRILNAPEWSVSASTRVGLGSLAGGDLDLLVNYAYTGAIDFNFSDRSLGSDAYDLIGASLRYQHARSGLSVSVWAKNLANEEVLVHAFGRGDDGISELYLPPRRYGVTFAKSF